MRSWTAALIALAGASAATPAAAHDELPTLLEAIERALGELGDQAEVSGLRVRWNRLEGIRTDTGSAVSGNTAFQNGRDGIFTGIGSTISGNTAYDNGDDGIRAEFGSTISGNTAYDNGDDGIRANGGASVQGNTVSLNGSYGLNLFHTFLSDAGYRENVISENLTGTVNGGVNLGSNSCNGTTTCP